MSRKGGAGGTKDPNSSGGGGPARRSMTASTCSPAATWWTPSARASAPPKSGWHMNPASAPISACTPSDFPRSGTTTRRSAVSSTPAARSPPIIWTKSAGCSNPLPKTMKFRHSNGWWAIASRDEIHHRQDVLLRRFLADRVVPFTVYYGKLFHDLGIQTGDSRGTDDLTKLPFTSKAELKNPRDFVIIPD